MKAKLFEKLLRKIVREEIDYSLRREIRSLKEDLRDEFKTPLIEQPSNSSPLSEDIGPTLREKIMGKKSITKNIPRKQFSSNDALNDLLNETAQGDTNLNRGSSHVVLEEDFSTIGGVPAEEAPPAVVEAVTRDYSGLMKAINKKKNK